MTVYIARRRYFQLKHLYIYMIYHIGKSKLSIVMNIYLKIIFYNLILTLFRHMIVSFTFVYIPLSKFSGNTFSRIFEASISDFR